MEIDKDSNVVNNIYDSDDSSDLVTNTSSLYHVSIPVLMPN